MLPEDLRLNSKQLEFCKKLANGGLSDLKIVDEYLEARGDEVDPFFINEMYKIIPFETIIELLFSVFASKKTEDFYWGVNHNKFILWLEDQSVDSILHRLNVLKKSDIFCNYFGMLLDASAELFQSKTLSVLNFEQKIFDDIVANHSASFIADIILNKEKTYSTETSRFFLSNLLYKTKKEYRDLSFSVRAECIIKKGAFEAWEKPSYVKALRNWVWGSVTGRKYVEPLAKVDKYILGVFPKDKIEEVGYFDIISAIKDIKNPYLAASIVSYYADILTNESIKKIVSDITHRVVFDDIAENTKFKVLFHFNLFNFFDLDFIYIDMLTVEDLFEYCTIKHKENPNFCFAPTMKTLKKSGYKNFEKLLFGRDIDSNSWKIEQLLHSYKNMPLLWEKPYPNNILLRGELFIDFSKDIDSLSSGIFETLEEKEGVSPLFPVFIAVPKKEDDSSMNKEKIEEEVLHLSEKAMTLKDEEKGKFFKDLENSRPNMCTLVKAKVEEIQSRPPKFISISTPKEMSDSIIKTFFETAKKARQNPTYFVSPGRYIGVDLGLAESTKEAIKEEEREEEKKLISQDYKDLILADLKNFKDKTPFEKIDCLRSVERLFPLYLFEIKEEHGTSRTTKVLNFALCIFEKTEGKMALFEQAVKDWHIFLFEKDQCYIESYINRMIGAVKGKSEIIAPFVDRLLSVESVKRNQKLAKHPALVKVFNLIRVLKSIDYSLRETKAKEIVEEFIEKDDFLNLAFFTFHSDINLFFLMGYTTEDIITFSALCTGEDSKGFRFYLQNQDGIVDFFQYGKSTKGLSDSRKGDILFDKILKKIHGLREGSWMHSLEHEPIADEKNEIIKCLNLVANLGIFENVKKEVFVLTHALSCDYNKDFYCYSFPGSTSWEEVFKVYNTVAKSESFKKEILECLEKVSPEMKKYICTRESEEKEIPASTKEFFDSVEEEWLYDDNYFEYIGEDMFNSDVEKIKVEPALDAVEPTIASREKEPGGYKKQPKKQSAQHGCDAHYCECLHNQYGGMPQYGVAKLNTEGLTPCANSNIKKLLMLSHHLEATKNLIKNFRETVATQSPNVSSLSRSLESVSEKIDVVKSNINTHLVTNVKKDDLVDFVLKDTPRPLLPPLNLI